MGAGKLGIIWRYVYCSKCEFGVCISSLSRYNIGFCCSLNISLGCVLSCSLGLGGRGLHLVLSCVFRFYGYRFGGQLNLFALGCCHNLAEFIFTNNINCWLIIPMDGIMEDIGVNRCVFPICWISNIYVRDRIVKT